MRLLGIDYGTKRTGIAIGDTESKVAMPLVTLEMNNDFWERLLSLIQDEKIDELVVGMPRALKDSGEHGESAQLVQNFIAELQTRVPLPIHTEDERLSSVLADRYVKQSRGDRDAVAAAVILQTHFDRITPRNS